MKSATSVEIYTTTGTPPWRRTELWREHLHKICGVLDVAAEPEFSRGTLVIGRLGAMQIALISADAHTVRKTRRDPGDAESHVHLMVPADGTVRIRQDDHDSSVGRGEVASVDGSRPYTVDSEGSMRLAAVRFPHRAMGLTPRDTRPLTAAPWSSPRGVGAVASALITELAGQLTELSVAELVPLGATLDGVVRSLLAERLGPPVGAGATGRRELLLEIKNYARERLSDPNVSPRTLAAEHNISLRYLQQLFADQGETPARWLRGERLERCHAALSNPRLDHLTVAAIGANWGLGDGSQMGRLFRRAYGVVPSELRRRDAGLAVA
ncbi:helix-turn-helix domain-containing protein [Streptomyces sp. NPDC050560]|uniref:AraC-like ligand-binding domain-containing protein n=1 Tax=Streptomyces sp. NPDC050560 TaxID=3365630 RepID=UPI0037ABF126